MKNRILLIIINFILCTQLFAQKAQIDPYLRAASLTYGKGQSSVNGRTLKSQEAMALKQSLRAIGVESNYDQKDLRISVLLEFEGKTKELEKLGVNLRTKVGNIYTADLPIEELEQIRKVEGLKLIETARFAEMELDESRQMVKIDQAHNTYAYRGEDVIIGFIDTGIDIDHPAFQNSNGDTRILSIWDQNESGTPPPGYTYGVRWVNTQINTPNVCTHKDLVGHGTHVAGIAAGNGNSALGQTDFIGMAPEADIIMVSTKVGRTGDETYLSTYSTQVDYIIDGINYIAQSAKSLGKPWVVNISFGLQGGPKNGSSLFERAISEFINDNNFGKGRIIVKSAGNNKYSPSKNNEKDKVHAEGNGTAQKEFRIRDNQSTVKNSGIIELYYPLSSNYSVRLISPAPENRVYGSVSIGDLFISFIEGSNEDGAIIIDNFSGGEDIQYQGSDALCLITFNDYAPNDVNNPDNHLSNGTWTLEVSGGSGEWDAYVLSDNSRTDSFFEDNSYSNTQLITEPGNTPNVITVGSVNSKNNWLSIGGNSTVNGYPIGDISFFSSSGPTRSGLSKPEIYAPGAFVASALSADKTNVNSSFSSYNSEYYHQSGTSMAAPHVSGVVALLLEKWCVDFQQDYSYPEIMQILNKTKTVDDILDAQEALAFGDIVTGIEDNVKISSYNGTRSPREISINESNRYYAYFYDADPTGDYAVSYDWEMEFYHAGGTYLANQHSTGQASTSNWYVTINESSLPDYSWIRDANGNVKGLVNVSCVDNDGYGHSSEMDIGLRLKPNKPIILGSTVGTSSVTLSYASGGSYTYKVYYGTSTGSYPNSQSAGSSTSSTISGLDLTDGSTYYFVVTGTNASGESMYSQELKIEPENITLQNQTISNGETVSFSANNNIEVGGNGTTYTINSGATLELTACNSITLKPNFHAKQGSNVHIFIEPCVQSNLASSNLESLEEDSIAFEESPETSITVYPNPNNGIFHVDLINENPVLLQLTDLNGNIILERRELTNGKYHFDLSNWPKGIYLLRTFDNKQKRLTTKKILHQ
jgi:subtilisin family serine protease